MDSALSTSEASLAKSSTTLANFVANSLNERTEHFRRDQRQVPQQCSRHREHQARLAQRSSPNSSWIASLEKSVSRDTKRQGTRTILPCVCPLASSRWASAASANGKLAATITRSAPASARRASSRRAADRISVPGSRSEEH